MRKSIAVVFLAAALLCSGCAYTKIQVPLDKNFDDTELGSRRGACLRT